MPCASLDHKYVLQCIRVYLMEFREVIGNDVLALLLFSLTSIGLVLLLSWANRVLLGPAFRKGIEKLIDKARELFEESWLYNQGFKVRTCVVSVALGYVVYVLLKIAFRFLGSLNFSAGLITFVLAAVATASLSILGYFLSPNIKPRGFLKHFYLPVLTGASFALLGMVLDVAIYLLGLVNALVHLAMT